MTKKKPLHNHQLAGGQEFYRWPPVGVSISGGNTRLIEEAENEPLPFLSRELRVCQREWNRYVEQKSIFKKRGTEWQQLQRNSVGEGKQQKAGVDEDVEASLPENHQKGKHRRRSLLPIHPTSRIAISWRLIMTLIDATYSAFLIPIACAFRWNVKYFSWYNALDAAAGVAFWVDVVMGFSTGFVVVYNLKRLVVMNPRLIAEFYVIHGTFIYDILAALPIIAEDYLKNARKRIYHSYLVAVLCIPRTGGQTSLHVIFLLRLARMYRVFKMLEWLIKVSLAGQINKAVSRVLSAGQMFLLSLLYAGLVMLNLLTCFWYYVASWEGLENSWLQSVGPTNDNISGADPVRQYVASFHFITATVTTIGYGDIAPVSAVEEICAALIMLVGVIMFGFIISGSQELVQYLAPEARTLSLLRHKMEKVETWTQKRQLSAQLRSRVNAYFCEVWLHDTELRKSTVFSELPAVIQADVCFELTQEILASSEIFKVLDNKSKLAIASRLKPRSIAAGHDLCKEGENADCFWILEEGEILAIRHGAELELLSEPGIVGEAAILAKTITTCQKRPYTLRAVTPCMLWRLDQVDMEHIFEMHPELMDSILRAFRDHLSDLMAQNKGLYDDKSWTTTPEEKPRYQDPFSSNARNKIARCSSSLMAARSRPDLFPLSTPAVATAPDQVHSVRIFSHEGKKNPQRTQILPARMEQKADAVHLVRDDVLEHVTSEQMATVDDESEMDGGESVEAAEKREHNGKAEDRPEAQKGDRGTAASVEAERAEKLGEGKQPRHSEKAQQEQAKGREGKKQLPEDQGTDGEGKKQVSEESKGGKSG